jgi:hypothetical protein
MTKERRLKKAQNMFVWFVSSRLKVSKIYKTNYWVSFFSVSSIFTLSTNKKA